MTDKKRTAGIHPIIIGLLCGVLLFPARSVYFFAPIGSRLKELLLYTAGDFAGITVSLAAALLAAAVCFCGQRSRKISRFILSAVIIFSCILFLLLFSWGGIVIHPYVTYCGSNVFISALTSLRNTASDPVTFIFWLTAASMWNITRARTAKETLFFGVGCSLSVLLMMSAGVMAIYGFRLIIIPYDVRESLEVPMAAAVYIICLICGVWLFRAKRWQHTSFRKN